RAEPEQHNKKILDGVRAIAFKPFTQILESLDRELVRGAFAGEHFAEYFFRDAKDEAIIAAVKRLLA
ncbi:MAG: hypothetical protein II811_05220, partial [Spirochaetaceae bacterium]|nr:hypothetical protein [Spirochaetaceae bacterium]